MSTAGRRLTTRAIRIVQSALVFAAIGAATLPVLAQEPKKGGTLVYAVLGDAPTIDCHAATSFATLHYVAPHYSLLVKVDPDQPSRVIGDLAKSWTVSDDKLRYTFSLHPNVKFHDGTPFTSADIKASFDRIRQPPAGVTSVRAGALSRVGTIDTPDPATVVFTLKAATPSFLGVLASPFSCIYSAARLAQDPTYPAKEVMGTGPFVFTERVRGAHWTAKRFDGYFRQPLPYLDGFKAINTSSASLASALQSGQVVAEFRTLTPSVRDQLKTALGDRMQFYSGPYEFVVLLAFNPQRKPFDDARVRRALSLAIDRWGGAQNLSRASSIAFVGGTQRPRSEWAPSEEELASLPGFGRDIAAARAEARRLLKEAGHENLTVQLINRNIDNPYTSAGIYLVDQWRQIGVTAQHKQLDVSQLMNSMRSGEFDAAIDFGGEWFDDPAIALGRYLSSDVSSYPASRFIDRKFDELHTRLDTTFEVAERKKILREVELHVMTEANLVPLMWLERIVGTHAQVRGYKLTPSPWLNQDLAEIWLAQ
jgi:peptide/nickel transport system substrate-binding protein